jgi:hypothetical protein
MEAAPQALELFGDLLRTLAQAVMQAVHSSVQTPWKELYVDIRTTPDGKARHTKFRVIPVSGALITVPPSALIEDLVREIWNIKDACFRPPWYGMKLSITSDGNCRNEFKYEPDCKSDPAFCSG